MRILSIILICLLSLSVQSQVLSGGSGICVVTGNPNSIPDIVTVDVTTDCTLAYNGLTGDRFKYIPTRPEGDRWVMEANGIDTNVDSLDVLGDQFRIREAGTFYTIGVNEIAPIQTLAGGAVNVVVTEPIPDSGDWIVNMTETLISVSQVGDDVTITDQAGTDFTFSLNAAPTTTVVGTGDISVTQPTVGNFFIDFTETVIGVDVSVSGQVTITDEAGVETVFATASTGVASIVQGGDITVVETPASSGNYVVAFTETTSTLTLNVAGNEATYTDENGTTTVFNIPVVGTVGSWVHGSYDNDAQAALNGCPINGFYEVTISNTLGLPIGTIIRRKN